MNGASAEDGVVLAPNAGTVRAGPTPLPAYSETLRASGRIGLGAEIPESGYTESKYEARFGLQTRREEGVRASVEFRADEGSRNVTIQDGFLAYLSADRTQSVRVGRGPKILGWEYEYADSRRLTIQRQFDEEVEKAKSDGTGVLFHCYCGCHRTGHLAAYYRIKYQDWSAGAAIKERMEIGKDMDQHPYLPGQVRALEDYVRRRACSESPDKCVIEDGPYVPPPG